MIDELIEIGRPLPKIDDVRALVDFHVETEWQTGQKTVCDLAPVLTSRKIYKDLLSDPRLFGTIAVNEDGNAVIWENGGELSAVWLEELSLSRFSNADFRSIMDEMGLTLDVMAATLEVSRRQIANYRKDKPIPKHIAMATLYLAEKFGSALER